MKLALQCHGEFKLTMEEMEGGHPRKKKGMFPHTQIGIQVLLCLDLVEILSKHRVSLQNKGINEDIN
ncbi:hypothetical protein LR48_Vigan48s001100 [Vigna angularis]|uniref:Uncharacterized protein n=1 Tax=Phaseolus angularis TaxID=3914 RepID=A0A0L9T3C9_PHAAN|nr:hypothetical protein LR48_Vigan48s001100 [Vigna angularis]